MSDKPEICQGLRDLREVLDAASRDGLRVIAEDLTIRLSEQQLAGRNLVNACRATLDHLRAGRIAEATEVVAWVLATSDKALAEEAAAGPLADMLPMGRA